MISYNNYEQTKMISYNNYHRKLYQKYQIPKSLTHNKDLIDI